MTKKRWLLIILLAVLSVIAPLTYVSTQTQTAQFIWNDVWNKANHRLMTTAGVGAVDGFETETTILNDVWDSQNHFLRVSGGGSGSGTFIGLTDVPSSYVGQALKVVSVNAGETALVFNTLTGGGDALTSNPLSQFAATTSAQLAGVISNETGTSLLVFNTSPTLVTPILGTPTSVTLTNATGLPISTGVSGLATGVATFLGTPTSANLLAALTTKTGTGSSVFSISPALTTPDLGIPSALTLTNATGLPLSTGVTGTLPVANGGTGATTLTGILRGTGTSAFGVTAIPGDATQFLNGAATPAYAAVKDSDLSTSDITTNNASTSKHGFAPKYPNDATKYLDGTGAYTVPAGGGGGASGTAGSPLFVQTATATAVTSGSETTIIGSGAGSLTIPAAWFTNAGTVLDIRFSGIYSTGAVPGTLNLKLKFGSTVVGQTGAFTPLISVTNGVYSASIRLIARTIGATGTIFVTDIAPFTGATLTPGEVIFSNPTIGTAVTVDTTATQVLDLTATWGTAATNSITGQTFEAVGPGSTVSSVFGLTGAVLPTVTNLNAPYVCTPAGASGTTYTCSLTPALAAYTTGHQYHVLADVANTGSATLNINSLGAKTIKIRVNGYQRNLLAGDLVAGRWYILTYDGTNLQLTNTSGNGDALSPYEYLLGGVVALVQPTAVTTAIVVSGTGAQNDLYTCPATNPTTGNAARCLVENVTIYNNTAGGVTSNASVKISGTYYAFSAPTSVAAAANLQAANNYILEAGEIVSCATSSTANLNCWAGIVVFDAVSQVKTAKITTFINGNNTVYTCPAATFCSAMSTGVVTKANSATTGGRYINASGGTLTTIANMVPNGGSVQTLNRTVNASAGNNTQTTVPVPSWMTAGDFVNINTGSNAAGQFFFFNVYERMQ